MFDVCSSPKRLIAYVCSSPKRLIAYVCSSPKRLIAGAYHRPVEETMLSDDDVATLQNWIRQQEIGSEVTDVKPLAGGPQNIVVGMRVDGRQMVMRRPP